MKDISNQLLDNTFITTNSFRVGDIELLWKDYENIEYVKQSFYHPNYKKNKNEHED